jgi:hypothetical protein
LDTAHRYAETLFDVKACEVDAQTLVEPIFNEFVEEHEVLGIENNSRRIAMMEANQLVTFEMGGGHGGVS